MSTLAPNRGARIRAGMALAGLAAAIAGCSSSPGNSVVMGASVELSPFHRDSHNAVVRVVTERPEVALSFDDGPDRRWTPRFLALLGRHHARATFFAIGRRALRERSTVHAVLAAGDEIGNHTLTHASLPALAPAQLNREIRGGKRALVTAGAPTPSLFRPPFGAFDEPVGAAAADSGEAMIGWDLPLDRYLEQDGVERGTRSLLEDLRPGSIVLAHDGALDRRRTLRALALLLSGLERRGYHAVTVGRLLRDAAAG